MNTENSTSIKADNIINHDFRTKTNFEFNVSFKFKSKHILIFIFLIGSCVFSYAYVGLRNENKELKKLLEIERDVKNKENKYETILVGLNEKLEDNQISTYQDNKFHFKQGDFIDIKWKDNKGITSEFDFLVRYDNAKIDDSDAQIFISIQMFKRFGLSLSDVRKRGVVEMQFRKSKD